MKLIAPTSPKELANRARWFKTIKARELAETRAVEFGFELKGPLEDIQEAPPLFWGVHLPDSFSTEWYYHPEIREKLFSKVSKLSKLKPDYFVLHGTHLLWHPPAKEYIRRYENRSQPSEYFKVLKANIDLIKNLKKILPLKIENYPLYDYYQKNNHILPETYLYTGIGRLNDLLYLKEKTGVDILFDLEHMIIMLNFLNRERNYHNLPIKKIDKLTADDQRLKAIFGFYLKKGYIPYVDKKITLEEMITKIGAKFYHLTGSTCDVIHGERIATHAPINIDDKTFRKHLGLILAQKPEALVIETANSKINSCWNHLRPNETEISFRNLCEILLEEL